MGRVLRARHVPTGAERAIKILETTSLEAYERFEREAAALARASGQGIVAVHDSGSAPGQLWFAMDLMPGGSLRDRMRSRGPEPWPEAVRLVAGLARALGRCHGAGLVHRDVKPENILFDDQGEARVADFGCVRDLGGSSLTQAGALLGTLHYMAFEQLEGLPAGAGADVFALGVILHELLTGDRPFDGRSVFEHAQARKRGAPSVGSRAPRELQEVLARALDADAKRRFPDGNALADALDGLGAGPAFPLARLAAGLGVAALFALVAAAVALTSSKKTTSTVPETPLRPSVVPAENLPDAVKQLWDAPQISSARLRRAITVGSSEGKSLVKLLDAEIATRSSSTTALQLRALACANGHGRLRGDDVAALASTATDSVIDQVALAAMRDGVECPGASGDTTLGRFVEASALLRKWPRPNREEWDRARTLVAGVKTSLALRIAPILADVERVANPPRDLLGGPQADPRLAASFKEAWRRLEVPDEVRHGLAAPICARAVDAARGGRTDLNPQIGQLWAVIVVSLGTWEKVPDEVVAFDRRGSSSLAKVEAGRRMVARDPLAAAEVFMNAAVDAELLRREALDEIILLATPFVSSKDPNEARWARAIVEGVRIRLAYPPSDAEPEGALEKLAALRTGAVENSQRKEVELDMMKRLIKDGGKLDLLRYVPEPHENVVPEWLAIRALGFARRGNYEAAKEALQKASNANALRGEVAQERFWKHYRPPVEKALAGH